MYKETQALDDKFDAIAIENRCKKFWEENKVYRYDSTKSRIRLGGGFFH